MSGFVQQIALREPKLAADEEATASEEQFVGLVQRQSRFIFRVAYAVLRNVHDAEDVVQETFLKLYRTKAWKKMNDERAFLARVAWRVAAERSAQRPLSCKPVEQISPQHTPEEELIRAHQNATVERLIDALPEELRLPLVLSTVEGLRSPEIAVVMEIPDATVRSRIARARKILKEKVAILMEGHHGQ